FSRPVDAGVELGVPAALGLSKSPRFRGLRMPAGVLVDLDVGGIDNFEAVLAVPLHMKVQQLGENTALCPTEMEAVDAVGFPEPLRQLIPLAAGDEDPPNAVESF